MLGNVLASMVIATTIFSSEIALGDEPEQNEPSSEEGRPDPKDIEREDPEAESAFASPSPPSLTATSTKAAQTWAVGVNLAWLNRQDYGASTYRRFSPEIVSYYYGELPWENVYWRAGARLGYTNHQPEMPQAVRLEETDTLIAIEGGLVREWYLVPSLSWGLGYDFRTTKIKTSGPLDVSDDRFNRKERLQVWYIQSGLGFPIYHGMFMIEPALRYQKIEYDNRSNWLFGFEATVGF